MYVENQYDSAVGDSYPSACFLRHEEYLAPEEWEDVSERTLIKCTHSSFS